MIRIYELQFSSEAKADLRNSAICRQHAKALELKRLLSESHCQRERDAISNSLVQDELRRNQIKLEIERQKIKALCQQGNIQSVNLKYKICKIVRNNFPKIWLNIVRSCIICFFKLSKFRYLSTIEGVILA